MGGALQKAARVIVVLSLIFGFEVVFPDGSRDRNTANAAVVGSGICAQTVGSSSNVNVSQSGNICTVRFNASNTWTAPTGISSLQVLVVGGGGGGAGGSQASGDGARGGGGGGAGGTINYKSAAAFTGGGSFTITVGAGGSGGAANNTIGGFGGAGSVGGSSSLSGTGLSTLTASGGGGGTGQTGGSGTDAGGDGGSTSATINGTVTNYSGGANNWEGAGGGAGAGEAGVNGTDIGGRGGNGGNGGAGNLQTVGDLTANWGAGGGGGGTAGDSLNGTAGTGGAGGGGNGGIYSTAPTAGTANVGGGGGGGGGYRDATYPATSGANGGSGTVIIGYTESAPTLSSGAVNSAGTQITLTFSEPMSTTVPATSTFVAKNAGVTNPVTSVTASGSTLVLALQEPVYSGQAVTVAYTDPSAGDDANAAQDNAGFDVATFGATSVTNGASATIPDAVRLPSLNTQTLVNLNDGVGGNIRGITSDGDKVYMRRHLDGNKVWEVPLSSITANPGGSRSVTPTSWTITNAPTLNSSSQLVYSSGCLFLFDGSGVLKCIDLATRSASTVNAPADAPFPSGKTWMTGNLIGFPDGRIGKVGQPSGTTTLLRIYSVSGTGSAATLSFDRDMTLEDVAANWPSDDHGAATDGTYLYRSNYGTGGYKVWRLRNGVNSMLTFNGDGSGACGGSGTLCNLNPSVSGSPILSNATFLGRDHQWGRLLVGDFDGARFYMSAASNPSLTVTYDSQGGDAVASGTTPVGGWIQSSPGTPTRAGYSFAGWFTASSGGSPISFPYTHGQGSNFTLYAQWTPGTYSVTYDSQGGSTVPASSWTFGTSLTLPTPTRAGYTFNGWSTTAAGSTLVYQTTTPTRSGNSIVYSAGYGKTGGVASTLTANGTTFNRVRYRMEANYSGTLRYADVSFDKWSGATIANLAVPDLSDTRIIKQNVTNLSVDSNWPGFTNVASTVTNGSGKSGRVELWPWDYNQATTGILPAGNGTVYDEDDTATGANYYGSFQVHNITDDQTVLAWNRHFDANPDIGFGNYLGSSNTDWTFAQKTNFDLSTWRLQIYIGDLLPGGSSYSPPNTSGFTLYAQWTANPLTVTYDSQLGSAVSAGSTVTGGSIAASPGTPTRAGYTFDGWFAASSGGSAITFPYAHGRTSDFTLYAQWTPNPLTVTYDSQLGSAVSAGSTVTGGSIAASPGTPTRAGHVFRGWFAASSGGSAITFPYAHGRTTHFTLYAQWLVVQTGFTITGAPGSLAYNDTVDLDTSGGNGTGAVVFASTTSGVCSVNASTGLVTMLSGTGTCSIAVTKAGDATYDATSASVNITATKATQAALTVTGSASGAYGATLSLSTTGGTTGGTVTWSDGTSTACTVNSSGSVSITAGTGTCSITASMAGNGNYLSVDSAVFTVTVSRAAQTALTVTSTSVTYGQTLTLTHSGGSGTGAVTWDVVLGVCTIDGTTVTPGDAGSSCQVRVSKAQDGNYLAAQSSSTTINVGRATQTALTVTSTSVTYGQTLTLTHSGGSGTGSVTWTVVSGSGSTCTISGLVLTPGDAGSTCVVRVSKAQDTNWLARQSSNTTITVDRANQTGFSITSAGSFTTGSSLSLTATGGQSTGSVTWSLQSGTCTLSGTVLTSTRGGIVCSVQATRAGDSNWFSANDTQTITVDKIVQTISFRSTPPSSATVGTNYTVTVDSSAFLAPTIVIANQSASVCSIQAGVVTFNSAGTCVISASQPGNDTYTVAAASQSVTVVAAAAAAPAVTAPSAVATPVAPETTVAAATQTATTTTTTTTVVAPPRGGGAVAVTTTTTTSTTTTTTTTIPADPSSPQTGADGLPPDLDAGETTAMVRGQSVEVKVERLDDALVLTLPNDVKVTIGRTTPGGESVAVAADGVLRIYREEMSEIAVSGLVPGTTWTIYMFSDPVELGRGEASGSGAVETSVRIPKDAPHGAHTLQFNGVGPGGEIVSTSMGFEVLERENDTWLVVTALGLAVLLALLGGRPIFVNRRRRRNSYT